MTNTALPAVSRLVPYVPKLLLAWSPSGTDERHMRVSGSLAFVDISGFTKLTERLSEILGEQVFHDAGLTRTDETSTLQKRVAELEQQLLDRRQDLQDRDDELAAARAANRELMTRLNTSNR